MSSSEILVEREGPVTTVIINRPQARNACTVAMVKALHDAFMAFEADRGCQGRRADRGRAARSAPGPT